MAAAKRAAELVVPTPILRSSVLDRLAGRELLLKAENLQETGAFKVRGAVAAITARAPSDRRGIVTASAGNFGQGIALAANAQSLNTLVMVPEGTPRSKIERIRRLGGSVQIAGRSFDECDCLARTLAAARGLDFMPPFEPPRVIEGQGTVAVELLAEVPGIDALVVPCGGGGLLAGVAAVLAARRPDIHLIAAEPATMPSLSAALHHGGPIQLAPNSTVADGVAVRQIGRLPYELVRGRLHAVAQVTESQIIEAIRWLALETKQVVEGAGAVALAAVLARPDLLIHRRRVGVIISGGNIDPEVFARVLSQ